MLSYIKHIAGVVILAIFFVEVFNKIRLLMILMR